MWQKACRDSVVAEGAKNDDEAATREKNEKYDVRSTPEKLPFAWRVEGDSPTLPSISFSRCAKMVRFLICPLGFCCELLVSLNCLVEVSESAVNEILS